MSRDCCRSSDFTLRENTANFYNCQKIAPILAAYWEDETAKNIYAQHFCVKNRAFFSSKMYYSISQLMFRMCKNALAITDTLNVFYIFIFLGNRRLIFLLNYSLIVFVVYFLSTHVSPHIFHKDIKNRRSKGI